MNADDLEQLTEAVQTSMRRTVLEQQQVFENRIGALVQQATETAANPTADEVRRLTNMLGQMELKVDALEGADSDVQFTPFLDKGESPKQWLRNFETCTGFKGYDLARQIKAFKMLMRNAAATWFDDLEQQLADGDPLTDQQKWDQIKTKFNDRFDSSNTWLEEHLVQFVNQKPGETVQRYYSGLMEKASKLKKTEKEILPLFIRGLNPPLKMYVLAREPGSLELAFSLAKAAESLEIISDLTSNQNSGAKAVNMPGEIGKCHKPPALYDMTEVMKELKSLGDKVADIKKTAHSNPGPMRKVARPMRCYHCGVVGHSINECRSRLRQMQATRWQPGRGPLTAPRRQYQAAPNRWPEPRNVNNTSRTTQGN